jgi:hypothetical protein
MFQYEELFIFAVVVVAYTVALAAVNLKRPKEE